MSNAAAGLYLRLHSFLDDQENDVSTEWRFTLGEMTLVTGQARGADPTAELLGELVRAKLVDDLGGGAFRLLDVQGASHEVREQRKTEWRAEKSRQRDTQLSAAESGAGSEADSSRAEAEAAPLPRQSWGEDPPNPPVNR